MKHIKELSYLILLAFAALVFSNCGTDDYVWTDEGTINDSTQMEMGISIDKQAFNGFEAVLIQSEGLFINQVYQAFLDTQSIEVYYISESALGFTMPNVNSGNYKFYVDGFDEEFQLSITKTEEVTNPTQSITQFVGDYEGEIDAIIAHTKQLDSLGLVENYSEELEELQNAKDSIAVALQKLAQLSAEDQQIVAQYLAANYDALNEIDHILDGIYEDGSFKKGNCSYIEDWPRAGCLIREMVRGLVLMGGPAVVGAIIGGTATVGLGSAPGAILGTMIGFKVVIKGRNRFKNAFIELANWAFIPVDNVIAEVTANKKTLEFENNRAKEIEFSFATRTINEAKDEDNADLNVMFTALNAYNYLNREIFKRPTFSIPAEKKGSYTPNDLSTLEFELIGNDKVNGELIIEGARVSLLLTTKETQLQNVKLRMYMNYGGQIISSDEMDVEIDVQTFDLAGKWYLQTKRIDIGNGSLEQQYRIEFDKNGKMISEEYNIPDNNSEWRESGYTYTLDYDGTLNLTNTYFSTPQVKMFLVNSFDDNVFYSIEKLDNDEPKHILNRQ